MKILFLLQEFPYPPDRGLRWKTYTLLKALSIRHRCDLLCFDERGRAVPGQEFSREFPKVNLLATIPVRRTSLISQAQGFLKVRLPSAGIYASQGFTAELRRVLRQTDYDVVHIDSMNLVQYARLIQHSAVVLSVTDAVSLGYFRNARSCNSPLKRIRYALAGTIIRNYERRAYRNFAVQVVAPVDRKYLQELCPSAVVEVVELAVDPTYLRDSQTRQSSRQVITIPENVGAPGVGKRVLAFLSVACPLLTSKNCGPVIQIIGQGATLEFLRAIERYPNVRYFAKVEDYMEALEESDVCVFLEQGGAGTKNRMLQAMALGIPLVVSPAVASGVAGCDSKQFLVCNTVPEFVTATQRILLDSALARFLGREARRFVCTNHALTSVSAKWEKLGARRAALKNLCENPICSGDL